MNRHDFVYADRGRASLILKRSFRWIKKILGASIIRMQGLAAYRRLARLLIPPVEIHETSPEDLTILLGGRNPIKNHLPTEQLTGVVWFVACCKGKAIGFVQLICHVGSSTNIFGCWLRNLHVSRLYRGLGIGEALSRRLIEKARSQGIMELFLLVHEDNHKAIRLYEKLGFTIEKFPALDDALEQERICSGRQRIIMRNRFS